MDHNPLQKFSHKALIILISLFAGCTTSKKLTVDDTQLSRSPGLQQYIDKTLAQDAKNKELERMYLKEIAAAQHHDDQDAYKFFIVEYIKVPRLKLPEWMKQEPGYVQPLSDADILNREFKIVLRVCEN